MIKFRDLTESEIECRVAMIKEKGLQLLLYKNSRTDAIILDETVSPENWQRKHSECKGNLYCSVGINVNYDKPGAEDRWIWKEDCGSESNMEKEKGEASDAFKRTMAINWGLGRELYTAPFIWIPADKCSIANGKCYDKFEVEKVIIENKRITALAIKNVAKGVRAFVWQEQK
jgi:hypothetical protein